MADNQRRLFRSGRRSDDGVCAGTDCVIPRVPTAAWNDCPPDIRSQIAAKVDPTSLANLGACSKMDAKLVASMDVWERIAPWVDRSKEGSPKEQIAKVLNTVGARGRSARACISKQSETPEITRASFEEIARNAVIDDEMDIWRDDLRCQRQVGDPEHLVEKVQDVQVSRESALSLWRLPPKNLPNNLHLLRSLSSMRLSHLPFLQELPDRLFESEVLQRVEIDHCVNFTHFVFPGQANHAVTTLSITSCRLFTYLSQHISNLRGLYSLDVSKNDSIRSLPIDLFNMSWLGRLNVSYCVNLAELPSASDDMPMSSLESLDLSHCISLQHWSLPPTWCPALRVLQVYGCSLIEQLPACFAPAFHHSLVLDGCVSLRRTPQLRDVQHMVSASLIDCRSIKDPLSILEMLTELQTLDITGCSQIKELPVEIRALHRLETLRMSAVQVEEMSDDITLCSRLTALEATHCQLLRRLPERIDQLTGLNVLRLDSCPNIAKIPDAICRCLNLKILSLNDCDNLDELPLHLGNIQALEGIYVGRCRKLTTVPTSVSALEKLEMLYCDDCSGLSALPDLGKLSSLQALDLHGCVALEDLPRGVGGLSHLKGLHLGECRGLSQLPPLSGLADLAVLMLYGYDQFESVPNQISTLTTLSTLSLNGWPRLTTVPGWMSSMMSLETLNLGSCPHLTDVSFLPHLVHLKDLDLGGCASLRELPSQLTSLEHLTTLRLDECTSLRSLPDDIHELFSLSMLDISGCSSLAALPPNIWNAPKLRTLRLASLTCALPAAMEGEQNFNSLTSIEAVDCPLLEFSANHLLLFTKLEEVLCDLCSSPDLLPRALPPTLPLRSLVLRHCDQIRTLPEGLAELPLLESLVLLSNRRLDDAVDLQAGFLSLMNLERGGDKSADRPAQYLERA